MLVAHAGSRADQVLGALARNISDSWGRCCVVAVGLHGRGATATAVGAHWVTFRLWIFNISVVDGIDEEGVAGI